MISIVTHQGKNVHPAIVLSTAGSMNKPSYFGKNDHRISYWKQTARLIIYASA
jgi:hypothetical protein